MKHLNEYITEKLRINSKIKLKEKEYIYHPIVKDQLKDIIKYLLSKNRDADLNIIDVSKIKDMSYLFGNLDPGNIDISEWDVSNVTDMSYMFMGCDSFNSDLSMWDVSNVKEMKNMFYGCQKFNSDLSNWNISKVTNMKYMFWRCDSIKKLPDWYKE